MSSTVPTRPSAGGDALRSDSSWLIAMVGAAAMYLPVYWGAAHGIWQDEAHAHGALIMLVLGWLFWGLRKEITKGPTTPDLGWGCLLFGSGLIIYLAGRVFGISILDFASQPFLAAGVLLLMKGRSAARMAWFPLFYFIFMIPLPGVLVDALTGPLKQWISAIVVELLYTVGYPISRNGVIITIGQYQMLVADACSGLHSMYSLSALGTLFMYIIRRKSLLHNAVMVASLLPIAFIANIFRVVILILITYHFGDAAGQGFLHGAAGMVLMLVALLFFFALDKAVAHLLDRTGSPPGELRSAIEVVP